MSPRVATRFPSSVTTKVTDEQSALIAEVAELGEVSLSDVLRDVIRIGLPVVVKEYRQRALKRQLQELDEEIPA